VRANTARNSFLNVPAEIREAAQNKALRRHGVRVLLESGHRLEN
jgi:hypothetical protein